MNIREKFEKETGVPAYINTATGSTRPTHHYAEWLEEQLTIPHVSDLLIAWEQFKKANLWESDAVDVEKVLMDKFQAIYGR